MTIKVQKILTQDLYTSTDTLIFNQSEVEQYVYPAPKLKAVTFVADKTNWMDNLRELAEACGKQIYPFLSLQSLENYQFFMFCANGPWQSDTRITRYYGLWKKCKKINNFCVSSDKSDEIRITSDIGVRYAGILNLRYEEQLLQAIRFTTGNSENFIFASQRSGLSSMESIQEIFDSAFPKNKNGNAVTSINWFSLVSRLCSQGDLVIRVFGDFDDIEASVDIFQLSD